MPVFRCRDACHYGYLIFVPSQRTEDFVYAVTQFLKSLENSPLCSRLYCHWLYEGGTDKAAEFGDRLAYWAVLALLLHEVG